MKTKEDINICYNKEYPFNNIHDDDYKKVDIEPIDWNDM